MTDKPAIRIFWFRRDLRLEDNIGLFHALSGDYPVFPLFIFDTNITEELPENDARISFIYSNLSQIHSTLKQIGSALTIRKGIPIEVFRELSYEFDIKGITCNEDYEPYARERDLTIKDWAASQGIVFSSYCDQVIFGPNDVLKNDRTPYTIFTPYSNKWRSMPELAQRVKPVSSEQLFNHFFKFSNSVLPSLEEIGFKKNSISFPPVIPDKEIIINYKNVRDLPGIYGTSRVGIHLRFGTLSIRKAVGMALQYSDVWLNELIWREFFMMVLYHFPHVQTGAFKPAYNNIKWINNEEWFKLWCEGQTGYPLVDAGMRELNSTGFMHNRVRMVTASFLTKHLLTDWLWGEQYFAGKLLDYELSSNNGNWQWAAGTGCDAAPYFRIFNPYAQAKKFDSKSAYINKWVPENGTSDYRKAIVVHEEARARCLIVYRESVFMG